MRKGRLGWGALLLALLVAVGAQAQDKPRKLYKGATGVVGLAVDAQGAAHVSWESLDHRLHYTHVDARGRKTDEVVDALPGDSGGWSALALDSAGRPHIAYTLHRPGDPDWMQGYARWDGSAWQLEVLGPGGLSSAIVIDADDEPHIVHAPPVTQNLHTFEYLHHEEGKWVRETPEGFLTASGRAMSLALDAAGHAHVGMTTDTHRAAYLTNASGEWAQTLLSDPNTFTPATALALDSQGRPHVAIPFTDLGEVHYLHRDGDEWVSEVAFGPDDLPPEWENEPGATSLVLGPGDRPFLLFFDQLTDIDSGGQANAVIHAHYDGTGWRFIPIAGPAREWTRLVLEPRGTLRGAFGFYRFGSDSSVQIAEHFRLALPDVAGTWSSLTLTEKNGKSRVDGVLALTNEGLGPSQKTQISFYLSEDEVLDPSDFFVGRRFAAKLAPGASRDAKLSFRRPEAAVGSHVIAVIDPQFRRDELDRTHDRVVGTIGK